MGVKLYLSQTLMRVNFADLLNLTTQCSTADDFETSITLYENTRRHNTEESSCKVTKLKTSEIEKKIMSRIVETREV
jgi:hypothetical protein